MKKKLSLVQILEDVDADLEAFSKEMEEDGEYQAPKNADVQSVWGGQSLPDDPGQFPKKMEDVYQTFGITPDELSGWVNQVQTAGRFTPELWQQVSAKVGDVENFLEDIKQVAPTIWDLFLKSGIQQAQPKLQANPNAAANMNNPRNRMGRAAPAQQLSLQNSFNQAEQASWNDLAAKGEQIHTPTAPGAMPTNPGRKIRRK